MRVFKNVDEFIDIVSSLTGRKFVTFGYVCSANLNFPQGKRLNPATGRMVKCNDMDAFGKELGVEKQVGGILKLSRYNLRFMNREEFVNSYDRFNKLMDNLKGRYGLPVTPPEEKKNTGKYTQTIEYGKGIDVYNGNNDKLLGRTYIKLDINGARVKSTYYLIDTDGFIIKQYTKNELERYINNTPRLEPGVSALRKLGKEEEKITEYIKEYNSFKMLPQTFEYSLILYMVGAVNGEKFLYINSENLRNTVNSVECEINTQLFVDIAKELYKDSFEDLTAMSNSQDTSLTEALHIFNNAVNKNRKDINKKALYESIMKNVAKHVKKTLNEEFTSLNKNSGTFGPGVYRPDCNFIGIHEDVSEISWWREDDIINWEDDFDMSHDEIQSILDLMPGESISLDGDNTYIRIK